MNPFRLLRFFGARKRRDLEFFPPFWLTGIRISQQNHWRKVRVKLPLTRFTRNMGGSMFGGSQASVADPIPAIACSRVFPGYAVWTRALTIEFEHPATTDLELRFDFPPEQEKIIRKELESRGRSTPTFEMGYYDKHGQLCARISNTVAIRPRGYRRKTGPEPGGSS
ncbi:MAG: DUF4442 domain-containing protein [Gammaproteobacteria bacterium]|nr:DUF4442 domain-containing protein [Gammaproteobacteria bacterium]